MASELTFQAPNFDPRRKDNEQTLQALQGIPSLMLQYQQLKQQRALSDKQHELELARIEFEKRKYLGDTSSQPPTVYPEGTPGSTILPASLSPMGVTKQETPEEKLARIGGSENIDIYKATHPAQYVAIGANGIEQMLPPGVKPFSMQSQKAPGEATNVLKSEFVKNPEAYRGAQNLKIIDDTSKTNAGSGSGGVKSKFWDSVDSAAGKSFAEFSASGGSQKVISDVSGLDSSIQDLLNGNVKTGKFIGSLPGQEYVNPSYAQLRDRVYSIIFPNLRRTLGAQFTEGEGKRVLAATLNPKMKPEQNAERLQTLQSMIKEQAIALDQAGKYATENGTLRGHEGPTASLSGTEFQSELEKRLKAPTIPTGGGNADKQEAIDFLTKNGKIANDETIKKAMEFLKRKK